MSYPGLIDVGARGGAGRIPYEVYEDVRLTALLDSEMIRSVMTQSCRAADLHARQELFEALLSDVDAVETMRGLYESITAAAAYHARLIETHCQPKRFLLFLHLFAEVLAFSEQAVRMPKKGSLLTRFVLHFEALTADPAFASLCRETNDQIARTEALRTLSCRLTGGREGEHLYLTMENRETYLSRLAHCASLLGIDGLDGRTAPTADLPDEVAEKITQLCPEVFAALYQYYHRAFPRYSEEILRYHDELCFCLSIVDLCKRVKAAGIPLCVPTVSGEKTIELTEAYDITLLAKETTAIVPNDASFTCESPFFYLTGANGGGKTTYLRTVAVSVLLFLCGAPVPCRAARIYPLHQVFTHFPRDERFENNGRSADEERRMRAILREADGDALILLNETYATTSEQTAIEWTTTLAEEIYDSGNFGIYVTHQHAVGEGKIPFLRVVVDRDDANRRTYKVERTHAEADSFARDILLKYHLDEASLAARFPERN